MAVLPNQAGFNLTMSKLQLVELGWSDNKVLLENADEEYLADFIDEEIKETKLLPLLQDAYNQITVRKTLGTHYASFTLSAKLFKIVELPIESLLTKEDLAEHLKWEYSILFPRKNPEDLLIRYFEIGEHENASIKKTLCAAVDKRFLAIIHKFCVRNRLTMRLADNVHFASNLLISSDLLQKNLMSVYGEDNYFSVMIFEKGKPKSFFSFEGDDLNEVFKNIHMEYENYLSRKSAPSVINNIVTAGDSFNDPNLARFEKYYDIPVHRINPFSRLEEAPHLFNKDIITHRNYSFTGPVGIAARIA